MIHLGTGPDIGAAHARRRRDRASRPCICALGCVLYACGPALARDQAGTVDPQARPALSREL